LIGIGRPSWIASCAGKGGNVGGGVNPEASVDVVAGTVSQGKDEIDPQLYVTGGVEGLVVDGHRKPRH
jgi:hypothetical protein